MRLRSLVKFAGKSGRSIVTRLISDQFWTEVSNTSFRQIAEFLRSSAIAIRQDRSRGGLIAALTALTAIALSLDPARAQALPQDVTTSVEQIDAGSVAKVTHNGVANFTNIDQRGAELSATVNVTGAENAGPNGDANTIEQNGLGGSVVVDVVGDRNAFEVLQEGGQIGAANNDAIIDVVGDDNTVILQQLNASGSAYFNTAAVRQVGDGNFAELDQRIDPRELGGGGLSATIEQEGADHIARIQQSGADNTAAILQRGNANLGTILQDGEGLSANLVQDGVGLDYIINQTGCVVGTGCGAVTVTQTGGP